MTNYGARRRTPKTINASEVPISPELYRDVRQAIEEAGVWLDEADFVREAIREKIKNVSATAQQPITQAASSTP